MKKIKIMKIDEYLNELKETWDYSTEELNDIKEKMICYAEDAMCYPSIKEEVEKLVKE
ncbi:MAG: hypothetical protein Q7R95_10650 [bacterium]|nr:hypothetical protein [bacterium]